MPDFSRHLHQVRDGLAFAELWSMSSPCRGAAMAGHSSTCRPGRIRLEGPESLVKLGPTDLIVLVTRPPLDDEPHDDKPVQRSGTGLERGVLARCGRGSWSIAPGRGAVHPRLRERLESERPDAARRGCIEYSQKTGAYKSTWTHQFLGVPPVGREGGRLRTGGYLIFTPEGWPGGPGILAAFGMGGFETMTWWRT